MWACNCLRTKHFHVVQSARPHAYSLKSRYGKVRSYRVLGTIPVGYGPTGIAFSVDGRFAYVSNQDDKSVTVIDTTTQELIQAIPVQTNPHFLVLGPDRRI